MNIDQTLRILMGAFLAQGLLAIITWWPSGDGPAEPRDLVEVDAAELASITLTGTVQRGETPDQPLVLRREGEGWILPDKHGLVVEEAKIEKLLDTIDDLEVRRPIAENAYRHAELDVADDQHTRKLVLETGAGETLTILVGSASNGSHVRVEGEDEVYRVRGVTGYGIATAASSYFDAEILAVSSDTVDEVAVLRRDGTSFTFSKTDLGWATDVPGPPGRVLDPAKAREFVTTLLKIRMTEPAGSAVTPEMGLSSGTEVSWASTADGITESGRYVVGAEIGDSGRFYLQVDGDPLVYEVMGAQVENAESKPLGPLFVVE